MTRYKEIRLARPLVQSMAGFGLALKKAKVRTQNQAHFTQSPMRRWLSLLKTVHSTLVITLKAIEDDVDVMDLVDSLEVAVVPVARSVAAAEARTASISTLITILILITALTMYTIMVITTAIIVDTLARAPAVKRARTPRPIIILRMRS